MATPTSVEGYLAAQPAERRAYLQELRRTIGAAAPRATETIAYQMPGFRVDGQLLVSYAAFKAHYSLFPASDAVRQALGEALAPYLAGKGTIRFGADAPLPATLVERIVAVRLAEIATRDGR
jgi:uncharacterized protein YdhG (YjbR/CyaY superfamily)